VAPAPTRDKPPVEKVDTWSVQRVAEWMRGLGDQFPECAELAANLERDMVDGASLIVLDKADVVRLGVTKIGLQKKFFNRWSTISKRNE
jgi:hypothetical protein